MPTCKNDGSKYYKGTEPSPKGMGWCAHAEKINTRKRGRDGNMWQVKKVGKSKRWMKVRKCVLRRKKHSATSKTVKPTNTTALDFRMIVGYYAGDKHETLTDAQIIKAIRSKITWDFFNITLEDGVYTMGRTYNVKPIIRPQNIKSIKVEKAPTHNPTLGERIIQKYKGWIYHPTRVIIIDFHNVKLVPLEVKKNDQLREMDVEFLKFVMYSADHYFSASGGWYGELKQMKHGTIKVLQISKNKIPINYRKFGGTSPF